MRRVAIPLGKRKYTVEIENALLDRAGERIAAVLGSGGRLLVVSDENVYPLYGKRLVRSLAAGRFRVSSIVLPAGERSKSGANVARIHRSCLENRIDRGDAVVALGGGVTGDLAGFAAATWLRGIAVVQIPTTLLAQVDSSVGGKTGINLRGGKNLVGAFHQPALVLIDPETLATLPAREYRSGLGEVVKYAMIRDGRFFTWLERNRRALVAAEPWVAGRVAERCCRFKKEYVLDDERDTKGKRAHLNFGHTFGHAVETATGYRRYLHGEAVSLGMVAASVVAEDTGRMDRHETARLRALLESFELPTGGVRANPPDHLRLVRRDKKVERGELRIVLTRGIGSASLVDSVGRASLRKGFREICSPRR